MENKIFMEINELPEFIRHSKWLSRVHMAKLAEIESLPEFDMKLCEGTIETACELFEGKEKEIVLTRQAVQLLNAGNIELAWQALLAIQSTKTNG